MQQSSAGMGCEQKIAATRGDTGEDSGRSPALRPDALEMQLAFVDAAGAFPHDGNNTIAYTVHDVSCMCTEVGDGGSLRLVNEADMSTS